LLQVSEQDVDGRDKPGHGSGETVQFDRNALCYSVSKVRIISTSSISLVLKSALLSLSKDARVSKDGHKRDRARGHPSRRPREERGLLRMRSESLISIVRCD